MSRRPQTMGRRPPQTQAVGVSLEEGEVDSHPRSSLSKGRWFAAPFGGGVKKFKANTSTPGAMPMPVCYQPSLLIMCFQSI